MQCGAVLQIIYIASEISADPPWALTYLQEWLYFT